MSRLDTALAAALHTEADQAGQAVDVTRARLAVEARLDRVDHRRRGRVWLVPLAVATAAAAVVVVVLAGRDLHQARPLPPTHPSPTGQTFTLARDPFLTNADMHSLGWEVVRDEGTAPPQLSPCVQDPRTWGAAESRALTYRGIPGHSSAAVDEFVLRFGDATGAHRALLAAWQRLRSCSMTLDDPTNRPAPLSLGSTTVSDEALIAQGGTSRPDASVFAVRIARQGNLVVVLTDTDFPTDRPAWVMGIVLDRASPEYRARHPVNVCFVGPQPCPTP
jgi:hypothetical protein